MKGFLTQRKSGKATIQNVYPIHRGSACQCSDQIESVVGIFFKMASTLIRESSYRDQQVSIIFQNLCDVISKQYMAYQLRILAQNHHGACSPVTTSQHFAFYGYRKYKEDLVLGMTQLGYLGRKVVGSKGYSSGPCLGQDADYTNVYNNIEVFDEQHISNIVRNIGQEEFLAIEQGEMQVIE